MAKTRLTCENCGFDEELGGKELKERMGEDGAIACSACGVQLTLPEGFKAPKQKKSRPAQKERYAGADDMTGLDDVIIDDVIEGEPKEETAGAQSGEVPKARVFDEPKPEAEAPAKESAAQTEQTEEAAGTSRGKAGQTAGAAREKLKDTLRYGRENPLFAAEILNRIFRGIAQSAHGKFDGIAAASVRIGHYTLLGTAALSLVFGVLISLRSLSLGPLLTGCTLTALLLFAQYLALKGFDLLKGYIEKTPSRLPGAALTEILSAFSALMAILSLLTGLILTVNYYSPIWLGSAALGVIGGYFAAAAFLECGSRLNVSFDDSMPSGQVFVELASASLKAVVAVTPFMFGLGSAAMALCMIWPAVSMLLFSLNGINTVSFFLQESGLLFCAFSPILAYFIILLGDFILGLIRAVLEDKS